MLFSVFSDIGSDQEENGGCSPLTTATTTASPSRSPEPEEEQPEEQSTSEQSIPEQSTPDHQLENDIKSEAKSEIEPVEDNNNRVAMTKPSSEEREPNASGSMPSSPVAEASAEEAATERTPEKEKEKDVEVDVEMPDEAPSSAVPSTEVTLPGGAGAPVTLEAIQNMQMAIAQFAAKTIANGSNGADNEAAMKQLAFLQQTLFNLQQQQLFQIQLIQQLQSQLALNQAKQEEDTEEDADQEQDQEQETDTYEEEERIADMELRQKAEARMAEAKARQHLINAGVPLRESSGSPAESLKRRREHDHESQPNRRPSLDNTHKADTAQDALAKLKEMENKDV